MKKFIIIIIILILFVVPTTSIVKNVFSVDRYTILAGEGGVAYCFAYNQPERTLQDKVNVDKEEVKVQTECKECKGTKKIKTGDGITTVACSCGTNCKCIFKGIKEEIKEEKKIEEKVKINEVNIKTVEKKRQIVIFTVGYKTKSKWCQPCNELKRVFNILEKAKPGWTFGDTGHIKIFDSEVDNEAAAGYNIIDEDGLIQSPTILLTEDGKVVKEYKGYINQYAFIKVWNGEEIKDEDRLVRQ